ncbi:two-component system, chemotaxis family, CheB/CheR fusion protein [Pararobbsia alpina]|uniref:CheR family methyltransferase n=1 Tax=Pararobbsia alpina TaxID=621374 RepID=UPI0039A518DF
MAAKNASVLPSQMHHLIVGVGASAGGIQPLLEFFGALPARTSMTFVVVMHLSPDHESSLASLIQKSTEMPVIQVVDPCSIEPDHVYLIAPSLALTMVDDYLRIEPSHHEEGRRSAIDLFFRTLGEAHRERSIGIVLSGAGSDGAAGIARVKEMGGITFAQDPSEAEYDSMPRSAIATNMVDFVLTAAEMPQRLIDLSTTARQIHLPASANDEDAVGEASGSDERALREILVILRTRTAHDFRHYKRATVLRRIERRMQVNGISDLQAYRDYLHTHIEETHGLLQDMLISVTNFFRDKEAFDLLESDVLPGLFENRNEQDRIRVWSVGCATGEEAYSLAILLQEHAIQQRDEAAFQIFATDIDERAVAAARLGLYPDAILADVSTSRIRQFFTKDASHYRIRKELREHMLFAHHNVLSDPPFSRLDLICCRNLLIYLDREAQLEVLRMFHFALRPNGVLFLGGSESADGVNSLFTVVDKRHRIYRANGTFRGDTPLPTSVTGSVTMRPAVATHQAPGRRRFSFGDLHQRLVEQHAPPSVLVNRDSEIVHLSDRAGRFLQYAGGEPSHNVVSAVRPELRLDLRTAIYQALHTNRSVEARRVSIQREGRSYFVNMTARPVHDPESNADFVLVLFDEVEDSMASDDKVAADSKRDPIIDELERELQRTKGQLQTTIEQSETSTEELKASNEELQAINEELRSATEELETSKEELQSINEELTTVNAELKSKVEETGKINDDLRNLIAANDIGTIFVDRNMRIKRFTPRATDVFSIIGSDIGRSLLDITHRLQYDRLADDAADAFETLRLIERELESNDGRWYLARFVPYRTTEDRIDGAVLSFIDITGRRRAEERLRDEARVESTEAHDSTRRRDEFLAVVSHELKHPLNLISASAELIARLPDSRQSLSISRATDTIRRTVQGQAQIIDDLLDISRVRTGKLSMVRTAIDVRDVLEHVVGAVREEAQSRSLKLMLSVPEAPVIIHADITRIEQVVWNLVSNALKFTGDGGRIEVMLSLDDDTHAELRVADTGVGIEESFLPNVFDMFEQSRAASSRRGGLGIGLALVKELVALHGGAVSAQSDGPGRGATFIVRLPLRHVPAQRPDASWSLPPESLQGLRVLMVDDDAVTVDTFRLLLETEGAFVETATSGREGLEAIARRTPDIILSDIGMPGMNGFEFIGEARKRSDLSDVICIALSGYAHDPDEDGASRAGFDAHLTKPIAIDDLLAAISSARLRREPPKTAAR